MGAILDAGARLLRRPQPPALTNWITAFMGRDRSYDITATRSELGYIPLVRPAENPRSTAI
jgi:hypothetical protein